MRAFAMAIGLAAIDGLLCAFVAMLVVALVLIGSGESTGVPDITRSVVLQIDKRDPRPGKPMTAALLLNLNVQSGSVKQRVLLAPDAAVRSRMTEVPGLRNGSLEPGGRVVWQDCFEDETSDYRGHCESRLLIARPQPGSQWEISVRVVDSSKRLANDFPKEVAFHGRIANGKTRNGELNVACQTYKLIDSDGRPSEPVKFTISVPMSGRPTLAC